jgi:hypothetical protein
VVDEVERDGERTEAKRLPDFEVVEVECVSVFAEEHLRGIDETGTCSVATLPRGLQNRVRKVTLELGSKRAPYFTSYSRHSRNCRIAATLWSRAQGNFDSYPFGSCSDHPL